jgi:hypothetical protein
MEAEAKKLITYLKRTNKVRMASYHNGSGTFEWDYYYSVSGWFNKKYFVLYFFKLNGSKSKNEISDITECKEDMRKLFNKYSINESR